MAKIYLGRLNGWHFGYRRETYGMRVFFLGLFAVVIIGQ